MGSLPSVRWFVASLASFACGERPPPPVASAPADPGPPPADPDPVPPRVDLTDLSARSALTISDEGWVSAIEVQFTRAVGPAEPGPAVGTELSVDPPTPGDLRWLAPDRLEFRPTAGFDPQRRYHGSLAALVPANPSAKLPDRYSGSEFDFTQASFRATAATVDATDAASGSVVVSVQFSGPVHPYPAIWVRTGGRPLSGQALAPLRTDEARVAVPVSGTSGSFEVTLADGVHPEGNDSILAPRADFSVAWSVPRPPRAASDGAILAALYPGFAGIDLPASQAWGVGPSEARVVALLSIGSGAGPVEVALVERTPQRVVDLAIIDFAPATPVRRIVVPGFIVGSEVPPRLEARPGGFAVLDGERATAFELAGSGTRLVQVDPPESPVGGTDTPLSPADARLLAALYPGARTAIAKLAPLLLPLDGGEVYPWLRVDGVVEVGGAKVAVVNRTTNRRYADGWATADIAVFREVAGRLELVAWAPDYAQIPDHSEELLRGSVVLPSGDAAAWLEFARITRDEKSVFDELWRFDRDRPRVVARSRCQDEDPCPWPWQGIGVPEPSPGG